jgi:hypothetical protein
MACRKIHTEELKLSPLRVVYRIGMSEAKMIQKWYQVDPKAEQVIGMYPYCAMGNNPISQMDPDGDLPFLAVVGIAFATGVTTNGISNIDNSENFWSNGFSAGLWSAGSAAVTFGIGQVFGDVGSLLKEFGRAGAHSLASGTFSHLQGGNFWHGAAAGGISSLGGSTMQAMKFSDPAMITGSAALGGLGSMIVGGDFWQGFGQGMAVGMFNHALHSVLDGAPSDPPKKGDWRLSNGSWGIEEIYDGSNWVSKDNGRFWPASGQISTTESPIEMLMGGKVAYNGIKATIASVKDFLAYGADVAGHVLRRTDAGHRGATFMRGEIVRFGKWTIRDYRTISIKYTTQAGQKFSLGYNPWKGKVIHLAPGH